MGSPMAKMGLRRKQQFKGYVRWGRRVGEESVRLIVIWVYEGTKRFCAHLMEFMAFELLSRPVCKEVLGGVGLTIYMRDILDRIFLDFRLYRFRL